MTTEITVRSLRELNLLVAQHITKPFPADVLASNPDLAPDYTTWAGLEPVIRNREDAGYWLSMEGACGLMTPDEPDAAFHKMGGNIHEAGYATGPTIPIAVCLAALASAGCRVRLELGDSND